MYAQARIVLMGREVRAKHHRAHTFFVVVLFYCLSCCLRLFSFMSDLAFLYIPLPEKKKKRSHLNACNNHYVFVLLVLDAHMPFIKLISASLLESHFLFHFLFQFLLLNYCNSLLMNS